jgi:hypothetical protein
MKFIKYFVLITTIIYAIGIFMLMNEGTSDLYQLWLGTTLGLSSWALFQRR